MNPWKVILATMVIFSTGVVTGGLLVRYSHLDRPHRLPRSANGHSPQTPTPGFTRLEFLRRAQGALDLTTEQREQADKLIGESQERMKKLWEPITPKIREELHQTKAQFRALLRPEQQMRFDTLSKQQQQHLHEQRRAPESVRVQETVLTNQAAGPK